MKLVMVFAFEVPEDQEVIQTIMKATADGLRDELGDTYAYYHPRAFVAIKESAEAVLEVFNPIGRDHDAEPVGSDEPPGEDPHWRDDEGEHDEPME